jgi:hypothetical protein
MPGSKGPTSPGDGRSSTGSQQEYERGFNHGYFAGLRACVPGGHAPDKSCCCTPKGEALFVRLMLGLTAGFVVGLLVGVALLHYLKP